MIPTDNKMRTAVIEDQYDRIGIKRSDVEDVLKRPKNSYTKKLLSAVPHIELNIS